MFYRCVLDSDVSIPTVTQSIKDGINANIKNHARLFTNAIKDYEDIAINDVDGYFSYHHHYGWCELSKAFMISPFSKADIDKSLKEIKSDADVNKFWEQLMDRDDFKRLVTYVKEHNINPAVSEDKIRDTYRKWVTDILSLKEVPENAESEEK